MSNSISNPFLPERFTINPVLRDILLSHILVREQFFNPNVHSPSHEVRNTRTRIRIHLIPYTPTSSSTELQEINPNHTFHNLLEHMDLSHVVEECYVNHNNKRPRNQHMSHLPKYQKINDIILHKISGNICPICYEGFQKNEYIRTLPICNHLFHKRCVDKWLRKDHEHMRCPLCRESHTLENYKQYQQNNHVCHDQSSVIDS